jgi:hypothetical protein
VEIQNKNLAPEIDVDMLAKSVEYVMEEAKVKTIEDYTVMIKAEPCPVGLLENCGKGQHRCCPNCPEYFPQTRTIALTKGRSNLGYVQEFAHEFWHLCVGDEKRMNYDDPREQKAREITEKVCKKFGI